MLRSKGEYILCAGQERGAPKPAAVNPFGGAAKAPAGPANPFGSSSSSSPRPFLEPNGMSPDMQQYPMSTEPWWKQITVVQLVRPSLTVSNAHYCDFPQLNFCSGVSH